MPSTVRLSQLVMKYQVIVNIDGYQEIMSTHVTPDKAIDNMLKAAKATIAECFKEGMEFSAFPTSDSRYPDAWGYANNGYCIKRGKSTTQYTVIEMGDLKQNTYNVQLIDLGLPSGTLWADRNVGADSPEDYGDYFRFGETTPCTQDSDSYIYDDIEAVIAGTDKDAATTILGAQWRMPTIKQIDELVTDCSREWTEVGGIKGVKVTGPNGNSIFLPAAGYRNYGYGSLRHVSDFGFYWAGARFRRNHGRGLYLDSDHWFGDFTSRSDGFPVRAVMG